ncbi:MAG: hypothetical protein HFI93_06845 [Lachnospiraceae bacterium]|nr:hypothetical protein [Lachnospiraceae bacterium]
MTRKNQILLGTLYGMPFGAICGVLVGFLVNIWLGIAAFAVVFVLSGWGFLALTMKSARKQQSRYAELKEEIAGETELKLDGLANYERGGKLYQGRLFLTGDSVLFAGCRKGGEEIRLELPLPELVQAVQYSVNEYLNTGLRFRKRDGSVYSFVVEDPDEWLAAFKTPGPVPPGSDPTR